MRNVIKLFAWALLLISLVTINACKKDDEDVAFALQSLKAGDIDLNAATSATGVPADAAITATFTQPVDPASVATLERDYDDADLPVTVTVTGNTITIDPTENLGGGTMYILRMNSLKSQRGETLAAIERSFTTAGSFVPAGQVAYWSFDGNADDAIGNFDPTAADIVAVNYGAARKAEAGQAAEFNGDNSIIEVPNGSGLINSPDLTLSFWVKTNSTDHLGPVDETTGTANPAGHFVMGLGAFHGLQYEIGADYGSTKVAAQYQFGDGSTGGGDLYFNGDGKTGATGAWEGIETRKDLTSAGGVASLLKDKWAHVTFVFNVAEKSRYLYINGELMQKDNFNLLPSDAKERTVTAIKFNDNDEVEDKLAFGFIQSRGGTLWDAEPWGGYDFPTANHFKGSLDDVRFFHKALTDQEVKLMYDSEK